MPWQRKDSIVFNFSYASCPTDVWYKKHVLGVVGALKYVTYRTVKNSLSMFCSSFPDFGA